MSLDWAILLCALFGASGLAIWWSTRDLDKNSYGFGDKWSDVDDAALRSYIAFSNSRLFDQDREDSE